MSGHSKWSTIKRKKGALDAKRGQLFTKLGRAITIAAREGGGDPDTNFTLRLAIDKAKQSSMPADNIERAVKRGLGELDEGLPLEKDVYGGYGPGGVAIAIDVLTDNHKRTISEVRKIMETHGGNLAEASSVLWQFQERGLVLVKCAKTKKAEKFGEEDTEVKVDEEEVMMGMIELDGVVDVGDCSEKSEEGISLCEVITEVKVLAKVRGQIEEAGYIVVAAEIVKIPEQTQDISSEIREKNENLLEVLEEHDDVENVWPIFERGE